ncbi:hypothetical protein BDY21DRAFT_131720 [Lineolata rhizophorae]|uniref:GIY-YIG domain-containing protein n=1 Tax=Lineolata rhizophorae TaxID=578093 RepID=A0A6A6PA06_9PEZI|nr:hypothetical protein BDY21DRAFT_131720 [Lineolata rhizophorae]
MENEDVPYARSVLSCILGKLSLPECPYHERYSAVTAVPRKELEDLLWSCLLDNVRELFENNRLFTQNVNIPHDPTYAGRAIYIHSITTNDARQPLSPIRSPQSTSRNQTVRIYTGQTRNLRHRISQHTSFRYRRDNPSLHYYALQQSASDRFQTLATLTAPSSAPGMHRPDLVLNILEMWCGVVLQTLPADIVKAWTPPGILIRKMPWRPLNVALPFDQGDMENGASSSMWNYLKREDAALVNGYLYELRKAGFPLVEAATPVRNFVGEQRAERKSSNVVDEYSNVGISPGGKAFIVLTGICALWLVLRKARGYR